MCSKQPHPVPPFKAGDASSFQPLEPEQTQGRRWAFLVQGSAATCREKNPAWEPLVPTEKFTEQTRPRSACAEQIGWQASPGPGKNAAVPSHRMNTPNRRPPFAHCAVCVGDRNDADHDENVICANSHLTPRTVQPRLFHDGDPKETL